MNMNIRIARRLVLLAKSLIAFNRKELETQLKRTSLSEDKIEEHLDCLEGMGPKEQKAALYWINKKRLILPEDLSKFNEAMNLINKQHLDFQKFDAPSLVIQWKQDKENSRLDTSYNPDNEPCFKNKKNLGDGVVVYTVDDSKEGQLAVRRANDACWGVKFGNWCLSRRKNGNGEGHELDEAWKYWNQYNAYPKRIAFNNGKLLAFSAGNEKQHVEWWDKNDESHDAIPGTNAVDDLEFLKRYGKFNLLDSNNASPEMLEELAEDKDWEVRYGVAENPNTPAEVLMKLADDKDENVRYELARNPKTRVEILRKLADDKDWDVRCQVAHNRSTPAEVLMKLADDKNLNVRYEVAMNPNTPVEVLMKLAEDKEWDVRIGVAKNPDTPTKLLEKLVNDKDAHVKMEAEKRLGM